MASATQISLESDTYAGRPDDVIPFTGHSQRRALLVIRFAVLDLGSCSKDVNCAGETVFEKRSALAGPVVNNPAGLFKSLETTAHFGFWRAANSVGVR